jgi:hypothetical protein
MAENLTRSQSFAPDLNLPNSSNLLNFQNVNNFKQVSRTPLGENPTPVMNLPISTRDTDLILKNDSDLETDSDTNSVSMTSDTHSVRSNTLKNSETKTVLTVQGRGRGRPRKNSQLPTGKVVNL